MGKLQEQSPTVPPPTAAFETGIAVKQTAGEEAAAGGGRAVQEENPDTDLDAPHVRPFFVAGDTQSAFVLARVGRCLSHHFFDSLLAPEDDPREQMQKLLCVIFLGLSPYPLAMALYFTAIMASGRDESKGVGLWIGGGLIGLFAWAAPWFYVRKFKKVTNLVMDVAIGGLNVSFLLAVIGTTEAPVQTAAMLNSVLAGLAGTPLFPLHVVFSSVVFFLQVFNEAYEHSPGAWTFLVDSIRIGTPVEHLVMLATGIAASVILSVGMRGFGSLLVNQGRAADATLKLTRIAAKKLNKYDTDGVREVLLQFREDGRCDAELLQSFHSLVEQLERYRPHLPNWMLQTEDESPGPLVVDETEVTAFQETKVMGEYNPSDSLTHERRYERSGSLKWPSPDAEAIPAAEDTASEVSGSGSSTLLRRGSNSISKSPRGHGFRRLRVSIGSIHFAVDRSHAGAALALMEVVDAVHERAAATHAALHSFIGDTISITWNAASRTLQPESNACRFLLRVGDYARDRFRVGGAVFTGEVTVGMAGTKQHVLTLAKPKFANPLHEAAAVGFKHSVMVACSRTMSVAGPTVESYPFDVMYAGEGPKFLSRSSSTANLSPRPTESEDLRPDMPCFPRAHGVTAADGSWVLHVVECEKTHETAEEWMYALQKHDTVSPAAVVSNAIEACKQSDYAKAASLLHALPHGYVQRRPLLEALQSRVQRCLREMSSSQFDV